MLDHEAWILWDDLLTHPDMCTADDRPAAGTAVADLPGWWGMATRSAIEFFYHRSGGVFGGLHRYVMRPTTMTSSDRDAQRAEVGPSRWGGRWVEHCGTSRSVRTLDMSPVPVTEVETVTVGGEVLAGSAWRMTRHRLERIDGGWWVVYPAGETPPSAEIEVTYVAGAEPPELWRGAARDLAVQLVALERCPKTCRLPRWWESVNRDGIAIRRLAAGDAHLDRALSGVSPFIDQALALVSTPSGRARLGSGRVLSGDMIDTAPVHGEAL